MGFRSVPKTLLRDRLREELASLGDDALVITDRGRGIAVVVSVVRWNQLQDILDELQARLMILERRAEGRGAWERLLSELD